MAKSTDMYASQAYNPEDYSAVQLEIDINTLIRDVEAFEAKHGYTGDWGGFALTNEIEYVDYNTLDGNHVNYKYGVLALTVRGVKA